MAKKKAKPNFPNPNPQPPGATQEVWKRWDKKIAEHIVRLFVTGICSILYRTWSELQEKDSKLQWYDPGRIGENCRKLRDQKVIPQLHKAGYLNEDATDWAEGKRPEDPEEQEALVKYILDDGPIPGGAGSTTNNNSTNGAAAGADHPEYRGNNNENNSDDDDDDDNFFEETATTHDDKDDTINKIIFGKMKFRFVSHGWTLFYNTAVEDEGDVKRQAFNVHLPLCQLDSGHDGLDIRVEFHFNEADASSGSPKNYIAICSDSPAFMQDEKTYHTVLQMQFGRAVNELPSSLMHGFSRNFQARKVSKGKNEADSERLTAIIEVDPLLTNPQPRAATDRWLTANDEGGLKFTKLAGAAGVMLYFEIKTPGTNYGGAIKANINRAQQPGHFGGNGFGDVGGHGSGGTYHPQHPHGTGGGHGHFQMIVTKKGVCYASKRRTIHLSCPPHTQHSLIAFAFPSAQRRRWHSTLATGNSP